MYKSFGQGGRKSVSFDHTLKIHKRNAMVKTIQKEVILEPSTALLKNWKKVCECVLPYFTTKESLKIKALRNKENSAKKDVQNAEFGGKWQP